MTLTPLTKKAEIHAAYDLFVKSLKQRATRHPCVVGWKGGSGKFTLYWHEQASFWALFDIGDSGRYWCAFGITVCSQNEPVSITCEINPPNEGVDRRKGGLFLRDSGSGLYLAHTGKIAGGRKGIGKAAFLESYNYSEKEEIEWPDGETSKVIPLGRIGGRSFINGIGNFIHAVDAFKKNATAQIPAAISKKNPDLSFTPEFEGPRKKYKLTAAIESRCDHGTVVNTLHAELKALGLDAYSTPNIDLYLSDGKANITHLIEVKTDQTTTSLYQAVGQVMVHGALENSDPQRIVVLPGEVSPLTVSRLKRLQIMVVRYDWNRKETKPTFENLKKAVL
jgi:hypothetical protein